MFIKNRVLKAISFNNSVKLPTSYLVLVCLRFLLTLLPQRGYIHPDEFFQNVEVIAGDVFMVDVARTWEFNPTFPIRSIFIPYLIVAPALLLISMLNPYTTYYLNVNLKTPYYLLVMPRLYICLLSLINDYCLHRICILYGQNFKTRLNLFASSYIAFVYCTRSFSNTFEMIFFSVILLLVAESMVLSDKIIFHEQFLTERYNHATTPVEMVNIYKLKKQLPEHTFYNCPIIGVLLIMGIFNRPTFMAFAFAPIFFWLQRGLGSKVVGFKDFNFRVIWLIYSTVPTIVILIVVDSLYYGYMTNAEIVSLKITWKNWVATPFNFLSYNSKKGNLMHHGLHPWWLHLVVNIPLLFNVLGIVAYVRLANYIYRFLRGYYKRLPRIQSITGLMLSSLIIPVGVLSLVPHQEARFIIPIIIPLIFLYGNYLHENDCDSQRIANFKTFLRYIWYGMNIVLTIFFGFIHQAGVYPFADVLYKEIRSNYGVHTHVITSHSYSIPTFLLHLENTTNIIKTNTGREYKKKPSTFIHMLGSRPMDELFRRVEAELSEAERMLHESNKKYRVYLAAPCSLERNVREEAAKFSHINVVQDYSFFPHFCTEAYPQFPSARDQYCLRKGVANNNQSRVIDLNMFQRISCYVKRFCYRVYSVSFKFNLD